MPSTRSSPAEKVPTCEKWLLAGAGLPEICRYTRSPSFGSHRAGSFSKSLKYFNRLASMAPLRNLLASSSSPKNFTIKDAS